MAQKIQIKGIREGLLVTLGSDEWPEAQQALLAHVEDQQEFLQGAELTLDVGNHILKAIELGSLRDKLADFNIKLRAVLSYSPTTEQTAQALGLATRLSKPHPDRSTRPLDTTLGGEGAVLVRRTLRSGNSIKYEGHVVIIGDVNPGAEIVAGGNIVVWGCLRGTAHAGALGDESAIVCALQLIPTQIRINDTISITPAQKEEPTPEIARLIDDQVIAEPWNLQKSGSKSDSRG
jgi:septum site-determining protein MinC